jgi:hypothetical protein
MQIAYPDFVRNFSVFFFIISVNIGATVVPVVFNVGLALVISIRISVQSAFYSITFPVMVAEEEPSR